MKKLFGLLLLTGVILAVTAFRPYHTAAPRPESDWVTEPLEFGTITEVVSATGHVQPQDMVPVGCDAAGRVARVLVDVGQVVKVGDPLAQLEDKLAQLRVQQARLAVELSLADVLRAEAARDAASIAWQRTRDTAGQLNPRGDTDQAEAQRRVAEAALKAAQIKVREAQTGLQLAEHAADIMVVRAPMAGVVLDKRVTPGQQIGPPLAAHLFTLAPEVERWQVTALVAEADLGKVRINQDVKFTVNAWPDDSFAGRVTRIANIPVASAGTVQYPVTIGVAHPPTSAPREAKLRPGMSAAVDLIVRSHDRVWKVPAAAASAVIDESTLNAPAKEKLARWKARRDRALYQRVWTLGSDQQLRPLFLRVGGANVAGEPGIADGQYLEVLAWDPEEAAPMTNAPPRVITVVPESAKPKPGLKLF